MTVRQIKTWFSRLFYVPRYEKMTDHSLSRILLSSVMGIVLCILCLAGLTWAWFSDSVSSQSPAITAADYDVQIQVTKSGVELQPSEPGNYTLAAGSNADRSYTVTIRALGTASTGYCTVQFGEETYHTVQLYPNGDAITFTVTATVASPLTITPQWGTYANDSESRIENGTTIPIGSASAPQSLTVTTVPSNSFMLTDTEQNYTVQSGDTLYDIAGLYGTTVDILVAYNDIQDPDTIYAGAIIKIPPADYTVSESNVSGESSESEQANTGTDVSSSSSDPSEETTETPSP